MPTNVKLRYSDKVYDGPSGVCRKSDVLGFEDMPEDRDFFLTISHTEAVKDFELPNKSKLKRALLLFFVETDKFLILGRDKKEPLDRMFGRTTGAWFGKKIALYGDPSVRMAGKQVGGVRIRDRVLEQQTSDAKSLLDEKKSALDQVGAMDVAKVQAAVKSLAIKRDLTELTEEDASQVLEVLGANE